MNFTLPRVETAAGAAKAMAALVEAVAAGELTPNEAGAVAGLLEAYRKMFETAVSIGVEIWGLAQSWCS